MKKISLLFVTFLTFAATYSQQKDFLITDYGAKPDGVSDNVVAIQHAIDDAYKNGGGKVIIPKGRFLTGVIYIKSNVELFVNEEAILLASTNRADYGPSEQVSGWIMANDAQNISITGKGIIDGQCDLLIQDIYNKLIAGELYDSEWKQFNDWHQRRPGESNRPRMIRFNNCKNITIKKYSLTKRNGLDTGL
ncbi:MAG: glycosyl hydrolase family 28-related protein [Ginsengibacter sp.]